MEKITLEEAKRLVEENRMIGYKIDDCNGKKYLMQTDDILKDEVKIISEIEN